MGLVSSSALGAGLGGFAPVPVPRLPLPHPSRHLQTSRNTTSGSSSTALGSSADPAGATTYRKPQANPTKIGGAAAAQHNTTKKKTVFLRKTVLDGIKSLLVCQRAPGYKAGDVAHRSPNTHHTQSFSQRHVPWP